VIRNIIFDWSGTIMDDLPAVWGATNYVFQRAGVPEMTLAQFRAEFCLPFARFYERFVPQVALPQLEPWFHERFRQLQASVIEIPQAREFLEFCRRQGLRTFVCTSVKEDYYLAQAEKARLGHFLDCAYTGVWDKTAKIHEILETQHLAPCETLFIGDMQHDIETARHGGTRSCAVLTGYSQLADLQASRPDIIVENLDNLRQILEEHHLDLPPGPMPPATGSDISSLPANI
jgi:phosphoglycolate phosphatase